MIDFDLEPKLAEILHGLIHFFCCLQVAYAGVVFAGFLKGVYLGHLAHVGCMPRALSSRNSLAIGCVIGRIVFALLGQNPVVISCFVFAIAGQNLLAVGYVVGSTGGCNLLAVGCPPFEYVGPPSFTLLFNLLFCHRVDRVLLLAGDKIVT
jgi:hypothetical protein